MADGLGPSEPSAFGNNFSPADGVSPCLKAGVEVSRSVANGLEDWVLTIPVEIVDIFNPGALAEMAPVALQGVVEDLRRFPSMTPGDKIRFLSSIGMRSISNSFTAGGGAPDNEPNAPKAGSTSTSGTPSSEASPSDGGPSRGSGPPSTGSPSSALPSGGGIPPGGGSPAAGPAGGGSSGKGPQINRIGTGTVPPVTDNDLNIDQWRVGPLHELPAQSPTNPDIGLQKLETRFNPNPNNISHNEKMEFNDIAGAPKNKPTEVRFHTANPDPKVPPTSNSASGPTSQINVSKKYRLPDGTWKNVKSLTPDEINAVHRPFIDR